jgi:hypothetical protein
MMRIPLLTSSLLLSTALAVAQERPATISQADLAVLQHNDLTMDLITRFYQASGDLQALTMKDQDARNALGQEIGTLDGFTARIQGSSALSGVVQKHGFTPRTFAVTELSVLQATFALGAQQTGASDKTLAQSQANLGNVALFQQHAQEIAAIRRKYVH